jgi:outer membrane lipopolysaccharide assembly protein LptE/RlpB
MSRLSGFGFRLSLCAALTAACGYSFSHGGKLPAGAAALRVSPVDNRTALAEAGSLFEGALRDELIARGQLTEQGALPAAELTIGTVKSAPSALNVGGAFAFTLLAEVRLRVRDAGGAELYADQLSLGEDYVAGVDVLGTEANRRTALRRLARNVARELLERLGASGLSSR